MHGATAFCHSRIRWVDSFADPLFPELQPGSMDFNTKNPALVIVILWGIAIFTTTFLFMDSLNLTYGIVIQGVCMIGSAVYLRKSCGSCSTGK
jgi:hypothetical protein